MSLKPDEIQFIQDARKFLENPSFLVRVSGLIGQPFEKGARLIPAGVRDRIRTSVEKAMSKGLQVVTQTIVQQEPNRVGDQRTFTEVSASSRKSGLMHSIATFGTGALGGFFGVVSLPIELPVTTALMLRSIVSIAQDFGHDISTPEGQLECLYVLSLGGTNDASYFSSRVALTDILRQAAREVGHSSAPLLVRYLAQIAARFELVVSEKVLAEIVPIVGALGGGALNAAFTEHFNQAARFHFGLRALEKRESAEAVRAIYEM